MSSAATLDPERYSTFMAPSASGQSSAGAAVATAGDVNNDGFSDVLIGDPTRTGGGVVHVYYGSANGVNLANPNLTLLNPCVQCPDADFGWSLAGIGSVNGDAFDDVAVGAPIENGGYVYIYHGGSAGLSAQPAVTLTDPTPHVGEQFGYSLCQAGLWNGDAYPDLAVGNPWAPFGELNRGAVYIFAGSSSGVSNSVLQQINPILTGHPQSAFGHSIAWVGALDPSSAQTFIIVGAPGETASNSSQFAYVSLCSTNERYDVPRAAVGIGNNSWQGITFNHKARFGASVAGAGDTNGDGRPDILVGTEDYSDFEAPIPNWCELDSFCYLDEEQFFPEQSERPCQAQEGVVQLLTWNPTLHTLEEVYRWRGSRYTVADYTCGRMHLGGAVAPAGDVNGDGLADLLMAAPWLRDNSGLETGRFGLAMVMLGKPFEEYVDPWVAYPPSGVDMFPPYWAALGQLTTQGSDPLFGAAIATAGDVNGDGLSDIVVGAPRAGNTQDGGAFLFETQTGVAPRPPNVAGWSGPSLLPAISFLDLQGDVNGDGLQDLAFGTGVMLGRSGPTTQGYTAYQGAPTFAMGGKHVGDLDGDGYGDTARGNSGAVVVSFGGPTGPTGEYTIPDLSWLTGPGAEFGASIAGAGDFTGDGLSDLVIGAPNAAPYAGTIHTGGAFIYRGVREAKAVSHVPIVIWGFQPESRFGGSVAYAGDVRGDGATDVVIGSPAFSNGDGSLGRTFVFYSDAVDPETGGFGDFDELWASTYVGPTFSPMVVASAGDVNGDGFSDVAVGVPSYAFGAGAIFVYYGSSTGTGTRSVADWSQVGSAGTGMGKGVLPVGDINGDEYGDLAVHSPNSSSFNGTGHLDIFFGSESGLGASPGWSIRSDSDVFYPFEAVRIGVGDANGDGIIDAFVHGNGGIGMLQFRFDGRDNDAFSPDRRAVQVHPHPAGQPLANGVIALDTRSNSLGFAVDAAAWSPAGRDRVRLDLRLGQQGVPLVGVPARLSPKQTWVPGGAPILSLSHTFWSTQNTRYRWRCRIVASNPLFRFGPWRYHPHNSPTELDLRVTPLAAGGGEGEEAIEGTPLEATEMVSEAGASSRTSTGSPNLLVDGMNVQLELVRPSQIQVRIVNVAGRRVRELVNGPLGTGLHYFAWNGLDDAGRAVGSGVYFVRVEGTGERSAKITVVR